MEDPVNAIGKLDRLRERGIKILIDDFGTGYSSLTYLNTLPLDVLKIAKPFNLKTIAEGVEREEQFEVLRQEGCDLYQGFFFSLPLDPVEFETHLL